MSLDTKISSPLTVKRRTGGRSARIRASVLQQSLLELSENGYLNFNIVSVAKRAEVHETTIYRNWETREALIFDAISDFANTQLNIVNTGNLADDLAFSMRSIANLIETPIGNALILLGFTARQLPELKVLTLQLWEERINFGQQIFVSAIERGEWPEDYDKYSVFSEVFGPILTHYFLLQRPISDEMIQARVQSILKDKTRFKLKR
jgi:AcrR family transcriptional regulator